MTAVNDVEDHPEELEQIPWGMLATDLKRARRFGNGSILLAAIAAVVATVVGVLLFRQPGEIVEIAPTPSEAVALPVTPGHSPTGGGEPTPSAADIPPAGPPAAGTVGAETLGSSPAHEVPAPAPYREADLMAVLPDQEMRAAAATAESFVASYFTLDGLSAGEALPSGMPTPRPSSDGGTAWVERTHAVEVDPREGGRYQVTVIFQIMATGPSGGFQRLPLRAVMVPVAMQNDGSVAVTDLPTPVAAPEPVSIDLPDPDAALEMDEVPEEVIESAHRQVPWDDVTLEVLAVHAVADGWRVTVEANTGAGIIPLAVTVES